MMIAFHFLKLLGTVWGGQGLWLHSLCICCKQQFMQWLSRLFRRRIKTTGWTWYKIAWMFFSTAYRLKISIYRNAIWLNLLSKYSMKLDIVIMFFMRDVSYSTKFLGIDPFKRRTQNLWYLHGIHSLRHKFLCVHWRPRSINSFLWPNQ